MNTKQLRKKILDLAIHGKLVPQDSSDEPASVLLERVHAEKERLIKEGKIKRDKKDSTITRAADKSRYGKLLYEIPENWCWAKIIDIAVLKSGGQYQLGNDDNSYLYIKVSDMNKKNNLTEINISDVRCTCKTSELVPINSIIFPKRGGAILTNKKRLNIKHPIAIDSNIMALTPFSGVELLYVRLWLESFDLSQLWTGNVVPQINNQDIYPLYIPIPPLAEQHRIISAIESAFAVIDEIERNKTDLQSAVAATKQKILSLAIRGKLVKQDPNDESASVLLERIRSEREKLINDGKIKRGKGDSAVIRGGDSPYYEKIDDKVAFIDAQIPFDVPDGWVWARLDNVTNIIMGQSPAGDSVTDNAEGVEFHQGKIFFTDRFLAESRQYTSESNKIVDKNSVLLCVRAPVGIVNITNRTIVIGRGLCALSPLGNMSVDFLFHWLTAFYDSFVTQATGTTFIAITTDVVRQQLVPIPPLTEQCRITEIIENVLTYLNEINKNIN